MGLWIKVEPTAGSEITETCREAIALAGRIGIGVEFIFNGVTCIAKGDDDPQRLADAWLESLLSNSQYKVAASR